MWNWVTPRNEWSYVSLKTRSVRYKIRPLMQKTVVQTLYFQVFYKGKNVSTAWFIHINRQSKEAWNEKSVLTYRFGLTSLWRQTGLQQRSAPAAMLIKGRDTLWAVLMSTERLSDFGNAYSKEVNTSGASVAQFLPDKRSCPLVYMPQAKRDMICSKD